MNIVLDTNILVSAMWSPEGNAARIIEAILANRFTLCYDRQIAEEYNKVLRYPKLIVKDKNILPFTIIPPGGCARICRGICYCVTQIRRSKRTKV